VESGDSDGYEVIRALMKNGHATGEHEDFLAGFVTALKYRPLASSDWRKPPEEPTKDFPYFGR
jgi:hypothetical protein